MNTIKFVREELRKIREMLEIKDQRVLDIIEKLEHGMDKLELKWRYFSYLPGYGDVRQMLKKIGICVLLAAVVLGSIFQMLNVLIRVEQRFSLIMIIWYAGKNLGKVLWFTLFVYVGWAFLNFMKATSPMVDEERGFEYAPTNEYGSTRPLAGEDYDNCIEEVYPGNNKEIILGYGKNNSEKVCTVKVLKGKRPILSNPHIAACGGSGSGKSYSLARPAILQAILSGRSFYSTETSGEIYQDMSNLARKYGYKVVLVDYTPDGIRHSDSCNYIRQIINGNSAKALTMATVILENTNENRGFWDDAQKNILTALLILVDGSSSLPEDRKNLGTVLDYIGEGREKLCARINSLPPTHPAKRYGQLFAHSSQQVQESALFGLGVRLMIFMEPEVRNAVKYDEVSLSAPGKEKCAYFVNISDAESTYKVLSALFFNFSFVELGNIARKQRGNPRLPVDVDFIMDEFTNIGKLNDFDITVSTVRKYGIRLFLIFQDIGQMMNTYPNVYASILSNCAMSIYMGGNDIVNNGKYYSKLFGTATVIDRSESKPINVFLPNQPTLLKKMTLKTKARPIYMEDEIVGLDSDYVLVKIERKGPLKIKKFDYHDHPLSKEIEKCNIYDHIPKWQESAKKVPYMKEESKSAETISNMTDVPNTQTCTSKEKSAAETGGIRKIYLSNHSKKEDTESQQNEKEMPKKDTSYIASAKKFKDLQKNNETNNNECDESTDEEQFMLNDSRQSTLKKTSNKKDSIKNF